ncbi:origin recognition complex subunit 3 N-terminus-domain-containing protein [Xylariaceae sp. FL0255]|nr:origin recognition complex subunit 3 N-terminus-domain-containing protein [Xylariaceae sp. FL0255]
MASSELFWEVYEEKAHQAAYIFDPSAETDSTTRPAKRRKVSKKIHKTNNIGAPHSSATVFQSLLRNTESEDAAKLRQQLFEQSWSLVDSRIQSILRDTNQSTLHEVISFIQDAPNHTPAGRIASAFIITGPNIAIQDLLFEQLSEALQQQVRAQVVRLRSTDASNLKTVMKKIIHDISRGESGDEDELEVQVSKDGRKFLNYDLEALHIHITTHGRIGPVVVAFQDSEAFDSGLLSELISLLSSWLDRIPFTFLFGVATSVELFETRLLKSTCQILYGDQFDVEQTASIVDKIFKTAVAHSDCPVRLGPSLVESLLERQRDQVASIPDFARSLKYAYMCHFYANPLTVLLSDQFDADTEILEVVRCLPSFRQSVEASIESKSPGNARSLLEEDDYLISELRENLEGRHSWAVKLLRNLKILLANKVLSVDFASLYLDAMSRGISLSDQHVQFSETIKKMQPHETESYIFQILAVLENGDSSLGLDPWKDEVPETVALLSEILESLQGLQRTADEHGHVLRSKYNGQNKVLRTTVVAQKVQLSQDTAALTDEDDAYTELIDRLLEHLETTTCVENASNLLFNEIWLYDAKVPLKDVFIPRPRTVLERALSRPHDYLSCSCCKSGEDQILPSLPTTAILYQLYLETGSLINAADLWSAYYAMVGEDNDEGLDERAALVLFYRAMAEMKAMGFVKQSRKKADHVAKLAWRGL